MSAPQKLGARFWLRLATVLLVTMVIGHLAWRLGYYGEIF